MQRFEALMYQVAAKNKGSNNMMELGINMLHKLYEARNFCDCSWMDSLESEIYRALSKYVFTEKA